jgi:two-component system NtrC family response regulator
MMTGTVLLVDDEPKARELLAMTVRGLGHRPIAAADGVEALRLLEQEAVDLVLTDVRMPGLDGEALLETVRTRWPGVPVILLTAYGSMRDAVAMTKRGAFDYLTKPFEIDDLEKVIANGLAMHSALFENRRLRAELHDRYGIDALIGDAPAFRELLRLVAQVAQTQSTVLLSGESGTGKEVIARAIHFNGCRADMPFIAVNCAAIPEQLLESEMFGHVKGAFTGALSDRIGRFQQAEGGTLFLDEIGDMALPMQAKILRVLQDQQVTAVGAATPRTVDVRLVAATNKNLSAAMAAGTFREDLYYRLAVFPIQLPPLRERVEDIPLLAEHFRAYFAGAMGKRVTGFSDRAMTAMCAYAWPGNIRELRNYVERATIVAAGALLELNDLPGILRKDETGTAEPVSSRRPFTRGFALDAELQQAERALVVRALEETDWVQVRAAELLGISERSLWHRLKKLGIRVGRHGASARSGGRS